MLDLSFFNRRGLFDESFFFVCSMFDLHSSTSC